MSRFYRAQDSSVCAAAIQAEGDPMGPGTQTADATPSQSAASNAIDNARANPDAWNARRDDNLTGIRGRS
jgi:hypothetical protein